MPDAPAGSRRVEWGTGRWRHPPAAALVDGDDLVVTAKGESDAWLHTGYGFVHDSAHALLAPMPIDSAVEVDFLLDYGAPFDQAGVWLHVSPTHWVKAGVEVADEVAQVGAVVTAGRSDWSAAPVPEWSGRQVTVRLSRAGDAVTVRARTGSGPFRLVRLLPLAAELDAAAGPYCASPTREGLTVRFTGWRTGGPDAELHP